MDTNQNSTNAIFANVWNLEKMEADHQEHNVVLHDHHQIPTTTAPVICNWPNYHLLQTHLIPSSSSSSTSGTTTVAATMPSSSSSSSGFLNDILGIHMEENEEEEPEEELGAMKEMMYKIAAMQPVDIDPATIRKPKRRNVRISDDPQSVAARHRRERISEKIRILQRLVPGGTKMDTASMLDEAIRYVKFLKRQIRLLQSTPHSHSHQHSATPQPPQCIGDAVSAAPNSTLLLAPSGDWPFAPNILQNSVAVATAATTYSSMDMPAGLGFHSGTRSLGRAGDGSSSSFNHHEVISE